MYCALPYEPEGLALPLLWPRYILESQEVVISLRPICLCQATMAPPCRHPWRATLEK